jgi:hypothetical protein
MDGEKRCNMEEIMLKLSEFRHNHYPSGVKMLAKFIRYGISLRPYPSQNILQDLRDKFK